MLAARPAPSTAPRRTAWPRAIGAVTRWREAARVGLDATLAAAQGATHGTRAAKSAVSQGANAVADAATQAAHVPGDVARELRKELDAWSSGVAKKLAGAAAAGVLALFALIVLTVGAIVLLNRLLGDPYGTLLVGAVYVVAALVAILWMRRASGADTDDAQRHGAHAREAVSMHPPAAVVAERGS